MARPRFARFLVYWTVLTLGTLMVEEYERPIWTFNKLVYIEKEGFGEALKEVRWAECHDCALLSSKGFSTRAARDLIDLLADAMHFCDESGEDFHYALCVAGRHYLAELNNKQTDERRMP